MLEFAFNNFKKGSVPQVIFSNNEETLNSNLIKLLVSLKSVNKSIAILVPTKADVEKYKYLLLLNNINDFSFYNKEYDGDIRYKGMENIHLTTFRSSKGTEFDTVIALFSSFTYFKKEGYEVKENDFYVGVTRAKENLYIYTNKIDFLAQNSQNFKLHSF
jgi:DNA helicase IV